MTAMELIVGARSKADLREIERFLTRFEIVIINEAIGQQAFNLLRAYNLSHGLLIPDAFIAATALTMGQALATKNQRDFRFIKGLTLTGYS
jgi:hypothetical protein